MCMLLPFACGNTTARVFAELTYMCVDMGRLLIRFIWSHLRSIPYHALHDHLHLAERSGMIIP